MYYKVWQKRGKCDIWTYTSFMQEINGRLVSWDKSINIIHHMIYEVDKEIHQMIFDEYGFDYEILMEYLPPKQGNKK